MKMNKVCFFLKELTVQWGARLDSKASECRMVYEINGCATGTLETGEGRSGCLCRAREGFPKVALNGRMKGEQFATWARGAKTPHCIQGRACSLL